MEAKGRECRNTAEVRVGLGSGLGDPVMLEPGDLFAGDMLRLSFGKREIRGQILDS